MLGCVSFNAAQAWHSLFVSLDTLLIYIREEPGHESKRHSLWKSRCQLTIVVTDVPVIDSALLLLHTNDVNLHALTFFLPSSSSSSCSKKASREKCSGGAHRAESSLSSLAYCTTIRAGKSEFEKWLPLQRTCLPALPNNQPHSLKIGNLELLGCSARL